MPATAKPPESSAAATIRFRLRTVFMMEPFGSHIEERTVCFARTACEILAI
jgi:hypothetical protein